MIGKRIAAVFIDPIVGLFAVPERDAIILWTRTFYGRGITRNLYSYTLRGKRRWRVAGRGLAPNADRYHDVGLWDGEKLLAVSGTGLTVVELRTGRVLTPPPR